MIFSQPVKSPEEFKSAVGQIEATPGYRRPEGFGLCKVLSKKDGEVAVCEIPVTNWGENFGSAAVFWSCASLNISDVGHEIVVPVSEKFLEQALNAFAPFITEAIGDKHRNVQAVQEALQSVKNHSTEYAVIFVFNGQAACTVPAKELMRQAHASGKAA